MPDKEKVIKGLECCKIPFTKCYNGGCPYFENDGCKARLKGDALALLKAQAQEPMVLTLAELEHVEIAYAEDKDKTDIIPVLIKGRRFDRFAMVKGHLGDGTSYVFHPSIYDYGKHWRCWTLRPTDEQREVVKWE